jgi:uncharacterized protein YkwD
MSNPKGLKNIPAIRQKVAMFLRNICLQVITIHLFGFKVYEFEKNQILFHKYFVRMNILYIFVEIIKKSTTMKNLILTITFILVSLLSFSQKLTRMTDLEKRVLELVNEFRVSEGLPPVKFDERTYNAASHHCKYLGGDVQTSHDETEDSKFVTELVDLDDRLSRYVSIRATGMENIVELNFIGVETPEQWEALAQWIVEAWKNSPTHRAAMLFDFRLSANLEYGAVSIYKVSDHPKYGGAQWGSAVLVMTVY